MPTSLQYPLERSRKLQQKWAGLLHGTAAGSGPNEPHGFVIVASAKPPRDPDDDDEEEEEDQREDEREPAVIRESDKDE
jgi:hypothetical protein